MGSALKYLSSICLNSKELFKGKKLPGDMELPWFTLNGQGKNNTKGNQKAALCSSQKAVVCYFNPLLRFVLLF